MRFTGDAVSRSSTDRDEGAARVVPARLSGGVVMEKSGPFYSRLFVHAVNFSTWGE